MALTPVQHSILAAELEAALRTLRHQRRHIIHAIGLISDTASHSGADVKEARRLDLEAIEQAEKHLKTMAPILGVEVKDEG